MSDLAGGSRARGVVPTRFKESIESRRYFVLRTSMLAIFRQNWREREAMKILMKISRKSGMRRCGLNR